MGAVRIPTMYYSETFKAQMVQKLTRPGSPSATELSKEVGVPQGTLSRWVRQARYVPEAWTGALSIPDEPRRTMPARRPQDWTAEEKYEAIAVESEFDLKLCTGLRRDSGIAVLLKQLLIPGQPEMAKSATYLLRLSFGCRRFLCPPALPVTNHSVQDRSRVSG